MRTYTIKELKRIVNGVYNAPTNQVKSFLDWLAAQEQEEEEEE